MMTLTPLTASSRSASGVGCLTGSAMAKMPASLPSMAMLMTVAPFATLAFGFRFQPGGVDAPRVQERRVSEKHLVAFDGSEWALADWRV